MNLKHDFAIIYFGLTMVRKEPLSESVRLEKTEGGIM